MLDLKKVLTKLISSSYTDGTANGWDYRKYANGTFEAWRRDQLTGLTMTSSSYGTYYGDNAYKDFSSPFTCTVKFATATPTGSMGSGVFVYCINPITGGIRVEFRAHASISGANCGIYTYIKGTWS